MGSMKNPIYYCRRLGVNYKWKSDKVLKIYGNKWKNMKTDENFKKNFRQ